MCRRVGTRPIYRPLDRRPPQTPRRPLLTGQSLMRSPLITGRGLIAPFGPDTGSVSPNTPSISANQNTADTFMDADVPFDRNLVPVFLSGNQQEFGFSQLGLHEPFLNQINNTVSLPGGQPPCPDSATIVYSASEDDTTDYSSQMVVGQMFGVRVWNERKAMKQLTAKSMANIQLSHITMGTVKQNNWIARPLPPELKIDFVLTPYGNMAKPVAYVDIDLVGDVPHTFPPVRFAALVFDNDIPDCIYLGVNFNQRISSLFPSVRIPMSISPNTPARVPTAGHSTTTTEFSNSGNMLAPSLFSAMPGQFSQAPTTRSSYNSFNSAEFGVQKPVGSLAAQAAQANQHAMPSNNVYAGSTSGMSDQAYSHHMEMPPWQPQRFPSFMTAGDAAAATPGSDNTQPPPLYPFMSNS